MRILNKRRILTVAVAVSLCITGWAGSASATNNGPVLNALNNDVAHQCTVLGTDGSGNRGVVCVDLNTNASLGYPAVQAEMELFCQNKSLGYVPCEEIHARGTLANAQSGPGPIIQWDCVGNCAVGRNTPGIGFDSFPEEGLTTCEFAYVNNVWAVVYGQGYVTRIRLPSGSWVYLGATANDSGNESTGHHYICP